jgi:hypothetical protein
MERGQMQIEFLECRPCGRSYPGDYKSNDLFGIHLGFQAGDMEKDYATLKGKGVEIISNGGPQTIPPDHHTSAGTKVLGHQKISKS